jgi:hypothetical protein
MSDHHDHDHPGDHREHKWKIEGFDAIFTVADAKRSKAHYMAAASAVSGGQQPR